MSSKLCQLNILQHIVILCQWRIMSFVTSCEQRSIMDCLRGISHIHFSWSFKLHYCIQHCITDLLQVVIFLYHIDSKIKVWKFCVYIHVHNYVSIYLSIPYRPNHIIFKRIEGEWVSDQGGKIQGVKSQK